MREKYLYYPGCTLKTYALSYEESALALAKALGLEFRELDKWYCCGAVASLAQDDLFRYLAPIRTLIQAQEQGYNKIITLCDMCYNTLQHACLLIKKNPESLEKINSFLEPESYKGKVEVYHLLQVLKDFGFEKLKEFVKKPLNLKLAPYYGCMLLKPREIGIDDPEDPKILENLIEVLGSEAVITRYRTECCGSYNIVDNKELVKEQVSKIVSDFKEEGYEAIVTSCPLCKYNLESSQREKIPIFYFTQVIALAFNLPEKYYLEGHKIDSKNLLKSKNLLE